jgi:hypothetical protein
VCTQDPAQECVCIEKLKFTQADKSELEQTHLGANNPFPYRDLAGAKILIGPMRKDPSDLGVDFLIVQLCVEGMIGTTWPQIHPHSYLSLEEWLDAAAD